MTLSAGTRIGPYVVKDLVGSGGMGEVYRAHDARLARDVAVKVLPAALSADADRLRRFEQEARAAAALNHPNILAVYDVGSHEGAPYVVSELLRGGTLRDALAAGALPVRRAVEYATQMASGLAAAHEAGVVHRDLKPENTFVTLDGRIKILDFGLAKLAEHAALDQGETRLATRQADTLPGIIVGTAGYMSPEQVRGAAVDHRSDLFSFGAILYEMLTGVRAFGGDTPADAIGAVLRGEPEAIAIVNAAVPPALDQIVQHCLEKQASARFQSTRDLVFALVALPRHASSAETAVRTAGGHAIVERGFRIGEHVCRKLNRASLDPRIIGTELQYLDNGVASDTVVCYLHGLGLDARDFEPMLRSSRYRGLAVTMYGFEAHARRRVHLSMADHAAILHEWLREAARAAGGTQLLLVGFSAGAEMWMQLLASADGRGDPIPADGLLTLDCNITHDTAFVSRVFARLPDDNEPELLAGLRTFGEDARSLGEWLNTHEYLVKVFRKFRLDIGVLTGVAREVVSPFEGAGIDTFVERYRQASRLAGRVRMVFSDLEANRRAVAEARLLNLDTGALGDRYREDAIVIEPDADHFDLLDTARLARHIDALVGAPSR